MCGRLAQCLEVERYRGGGGGGVVAYFFLRCVVSDPCYIKTHVSYTMTNSKRQT